MDPRAPLPSKRDARETLHSEALRALARFLARQAAQEALRAGPVPQTENRDDDPPQPDQ